MPTGKRCGKIITVLKGYGKEEDMILDKLFLSFAFMLIIGLLVTWFWNRTPAKDKTDVTIGSVMVLLDLAWFVGFVITGLLGIWF